MLRRHLRVRRHLPGLRRRRPLRRQAGPREENHEVSRFKKCRSSFVTESSKRKNLA